MLVEEKRKFVDQYCDQHHCTECVLDKYEWDCSDLNDKSKQELDEAIELINKEKKESEEQIMEQSYPTLESLIGKVVEFEGGVKSIVVITKKHTVDKN